MYKYSCRDCRIRERCIDQNDSPVHVRTMIRTAFSARTDTLAMWGILQKSCLLVQEDEERERKAQEGSILSRRLRELREAKEAGDEPSAEAVDQGAEPTEPASPAAPSTGSISQILPTTPDIDLILPPPPTDIGSSRSKTARIGGYEATAKPSSEPVQPERPTTAGPAPLCWLILNDSQRRISLPLTGKLTLGRFDPDTTTPVDVDLTYEDRAELSVSRRHAQIEGVAGHHTIEDLGSSNGVYVNGEQIMAERVCPLQPGDQIVLGWLQLRYATVPTDFFSTLRARGSQLRHFLFIAYTGRKVPLSPPDNLIIGRADPSSNLAVDLDLDQEGEVAFRVSRRHARISWSNYLPYLQDLNSTFGTRLNGDRLAAGQSVLLKPGDHLSLGGCVLAYDVEL